MDLARTVGMTVASMYFVTSMHTEQVQFARSAVGLAYARSYQTRAAVVLGAVAWRLSECRPA